MLYVTNRCADMVDGMREPVRVFKDRYDGQDYEFPFNEKVLISEEAARHIFGWGLKDRTEALVRQGWANDPLKVRWMGKFVFTNTKIVEEGTAEGLINTEGLPGNATKEEKQPEPESKVGGVASLLPGIAKVFPDLKADRRPTA